VNYYPALAIAAILLASTGTAYAQPANESRIYGCQEYAETMHCDLLMNELEAFEVTGNTTLVDPVVATETLFVDGKQGQALEMRAEYRESIEVMNVPAISPEQFTMSFWIKTTRIEPYSHIISHSNKAQSAGWLFDMFSNSNATGVANPVLRFGVFNSEGTLFSPPDVTVPQNAFVHIVGTFDGSTLKVYKDGALAGEADFEGNYTADAGVPLRVGSAAYCTSCNRWTGVIDDMRMYNRTLDSDEVKQVFGMGEVPSGLVGHWTLDGSVEDATGMNSGTSTTMVASMVFAPDGRLFFTEKNAGDIRIMSADGKIQEKPFASVPDAYVSWEQGMLGMTLDPEFESNHFVYVYYSALVDTDNGSGGKVVNKLLRFTDSNGTGTDMKVLMDDIPASRGFHSGGALGFGPDDKLYVTVGDATEHIFAQDPSIVLGKILRINRDGTIPEDNPYPGSPVYTIGHRNMYGVAFDSNGNGLVTENGDFHYDEINLIQRGGNYGFPTLQPPNVPPEMANDTTSIKPLRTYYDAIAPTQMIYYDGDAVPELKGMFLFGSFTGDIYGIKLQDGKIVQEIKVDLALFPFVPTIGIAQSPDGEIYFAGYQIYKLSSIGERAQMLFPVQVDAPAAVRISDLQLIEGENRMVINAQLAGALAPDATLTARIPKVLLDNITSVALDDSAGQTVDFDVDNSDPSYSTITVNIGSMAGDLRLAIMGASVVPEFPAGLVAMAAAAAVMSAAIAAKRKGMLG
jgi:glucose/arabinose dehydrogenase